jgi:hypothetical protein
MENGWDFPIELPLDIDNTGLVDKLNIQCSIERLLEAVRKGE